METHPEAIKKNDWLFVKHCWLDTNYIDTHPLLWESVISRIQPVASHLKTNFIELTHALVQIGLPWTGQHFGELQNAEIMSIDEIVNKK